MKRASSQPLLRHCKENDYRKKRGDNNIVKNRVLTEKDIQEDDEEGYDDIAEQIQCIALHKKSQQSSNRGEELSWKKYGLWRQKQKSRAARLEKQVKARWALEDLIEEQLSLFHAHYNQAVVPTRLTDVSKLLQPKWASPLELASLAWLGDWRPSAMLDLLGSLSRSSPSLSDSNGVEQVLSKLIHDIRIEEAVIDEEMAEIQANCILHLSFGSVSNQSTGPAVAHAQSEFNKIHRVIVKAQNLRFKVLELIVKKVVSQTDAVEFLVAFAGIQDTIHQIARKHKLLKGPVSLPVKSLGSS